MPAPLPQAPKQRPVWLMFLSFAMLFSAVQLGAAGLDELVRSPAAPAANAVVLDFEDVRARVQLMAEAVARDRHPVVVKLHALAQVLMAGFSLFAVATVMARDPRGRAFAILAGWLRIGHELVEVLFALLVTRPALLSIGPQFLDELARLSGPKAELDRKAFAAMLETSTVLVPLVGALLGILVSLLIVSTFRGRRGRVLYGLPPAPGGPG